MGGRSPHRNRVPALRLARTALAVLRFDYPGLSWHTLGGHFREAEPFWEAVAAEVPGGYRRRRPPPSCGR
ncbi:hypothetical protein ETD85_49875 [Nonomuraea zeae]|uniref:Uncharacterized protein n=1 Tax=Nonomuraea zeae TaxID=1642303 RepID=A0A5S4G848_9ACTN|nr:hypothetical protein ETD85_49875 [Nonomuraea zeae]